MASTDLLFRTDERAPLELVFADAGEPGGGGGDYTLHIAGLVTRAGGAVHLHVGLQCAVAGAVARVAGSIAAGYDSNVDRPLLGRHSGTQQVAAPVAASMRTVWQLSHPASSAHRSAAQRARPLAGVGRPQWQRTQPLGSLGRPAFEPALPINAATRAAFQRTLALGSAGRARFQPGAPLLGGGRMAFQRVIQLSRLARPHFQPGQAAAALLHASMQLGRPMLPVWRLRFQPGRYPLPGITVRPVRPPRADWCYVPAQPVDLLFAQDERAPLDLLFFCDRHASEPEQPPATIVVPVRRVYLVINEIDLRRVDGNLPLPAYTLALSLDADSWTWQWSATLHKSALALLAPAQAGAPVLVQASINSVPYRLLVESVQRDRKFAETRIQVSGRGVAALLDAPYAPSMGFGNPSGARTAEQLMIDVLTLNGVGIGWDVDFGLSDWLVPAGVFSHQGTWISAINAIAQAAGGYVQPHPTAQTLRILHRYPVAPWDLGALAPDIDLPMAPVAVEGVAWAAKADYNCVYVSGEGAGVLANVKRAGTAGDIEAPLVVDPLITHADAAAQRGRAILADTGAQANVSLSLPVLSETGLILPGTFIRRTDGAEVLQGYVRSMSLTWDAPRMRQTIEVQTHG